MKKVFKTLIYRYKRRFTMKKLYNAPELEVTKFEFEQAVLVSPTDPGNIITNPWTTSDPDETMTDIPWGDW